MKKIKIKTLDYYNTPKYYATMPQEIFEALELAFLKDEEYIEVPENLFNIMINANEENKA